MTEVEEVNGPAGFSRVRSIENSPNRWDLVEDGWSDDDEGGPVENLRRWESSDGVEVVTVSSTGRDLQAFCRDVLSRMLLERAFATGSDKAEMQRLTRQGHEATVIEDGNQLDAAGALPRGVQVSAAGLTARAASSRSMQFVVVYPGGEPEASRLQITVG